MADNTIDRLKAQLLKSGLQVKDQILYQIINQLIDAVSATNKSLATATGSSGGGGTLSQSFLTKNLDQASLPNSRRLYPGAGIQLNDQGDNLVISTAIPFGLDGGGEGEDGPPGPPGRDGVAGAAGPAGLNATAFFYGFDGIDGEDAPILPGPTGIAGATGAAGLIGPQGIPGLDGNDGLDSTIPGPIGLTGATGLTGASGPPGMPGLDGEDPIEPMLVQGPTGARGPGMNTLKTTANQTINAGAAVYVNITDLTFPVVAGTDYAFYFYIAFQSANINTGWKAGLNHPGGTLDFFNTYQTVANAASGVSTWLHRHNTAVDDMTLLTSTITAAVDLVCIFSGRYKCTVSGTFAARFANELAADLNIVVQKGSWGFYF